MATSNPRRRSVAATPDTVTDNASTLRKGATFHPANANNTTFVPPNLPRTLSNNDECIDARRRRMALTLSDIDEALSMTQALSLSDKPKKFTLEDTSIPLPRGFLQAPIVDPAMAKRDAERRILRPRSVRRSQEHASDSGIGSSIASSNEKRAMMNTSKAKTQTVPAYRTRSVTAAAVNPSALKPRSVNRIQEHTLRPLLEKPTLKPFEAIVLDIPRRIRAQEIICLRDVEKTLIFMAPVSQLLSDNGVWGVTYRNLRLKEKAKTAALYLDFCLTSIRCVQATVEYLNEDDQIRPDDRPYTNGYFIDLKEQIYQYGRQLAAKEKGDMSDDMDLDQYVPRFVPLAQPADSHDRDDEIRLHGGIAITGRPAELIRVKKDGTAISMATGKPIDLDEEPAKFKRSLSQQLEDDEEIMRSMARRKKNATPEELAPKKCREPGCNKEFKRPCDLTKHEKTHSRPFKCPHPTCKYHNFGWPTAKEMDRHVNDKHSDSPSIYECMFKPCPYKSKRESNCKQHMEKAHGWHYVRTKSNGGKKLPSKPLTPPHETPQLGNMPTPSSASNYSVSTPPQDEMLQGITGDFSAFAGENAWMGSAGIPQQQLGDVDLLMDNNSPSSSTSYERYPPYQNGSTFIMNNDEDLYAARVQLPQQMPHQLFDKMMPQQMQAYQHMQQPQQHMQQLVQAPMELPAHFSPSGQENAMLYTPTSLQEVEDVFEDPAVTGGNDFQLFPVDLAKTADFQPLFDMPSADLGFSQQTQPDILQQIDWSNVDMSNFQE